jgi:hypothetical protein
VVNGRSIVTTFCNSLIDGRDTIGKVSPEEETAFNSEFSAQFPPMSIWHGLLSLYSRRAVWKQSKSIVEFLEEVKAITDRDGLDSSDGKTKLLNGFVVPSSIEADTRSYSYYVNSLCFAGSFLAAFDVVRHMRNNLKMEPDEQTAMVFMRRVSNPAHVPDENLEKTVQLCIDVIADFSDKIPDRAGLQLQSLNVLVASLCIRGMCTLFIDRYIQFNLPCHVLFV